MHLDPSTLCARTSTGDAELLKPTRGLTLGQRRTLAQLDAPRVMDEWVGSLDLDPIKLERDLFRLARRGLVALHTPSGQPTPVPVVGAAVLTARDMPLPPGATMLLSGVVMVCVVALGLVWTMFHH
jgi:hypothetical protein